MEYTYPDYYNQFNCIADKCEATCCEGWQIVISNKYLDKYKNYKGTFGNRLVNSIDFKEKCFKQCKKRCAFLNEDNLCDIYLEAGKDMLCNTCKNYPRHVEEYEGLREVSLSLSCPEAARIILGNREKVHFITKEVNTKEEDYDVFDYILFTKLMDTRDVMLSILTNRNVDIHVRFACVLAMSHDIQTRIDKNSMFEIDDVISRYSKDNENDCKRFKAVFNLKISKNSSREYEFMTHAFSTLHKLEHLDDNWDSYLNSMEDILFGNGIEGYLSVTANRVDQVVMEQLMSYFVYTYFAGSVYDQRPYDIMRFSVYSTCIIEKLILANSYKDGIINDKCIVEMAYLYSREIEHSDVNITLLEKELRTDATYNLYKMLEVL